MNEVGKILAPRVPGKIVQCAALMLLVLGTLLPQSAFAVTITLKDDGDGALTCTLRRAITLHDMAVQGEDINFKFGCELPVGGADTIVVPYRKVHMDAPPPLILGNLTIVHSTQDCGEIEGGTFFSVVPGASFTVSGMGFTADDSKNVSLIDNNGGTVTLKQLGVPCTFTDQKTKNPPNTGGVIFNHNNGKVTVSGAKFVRNHAKSAGGVIYNDSGTITIDDSAGNVRTIFNNNHAFRGGVVYQNANGKLNISSKNFAMFTNRADDVGGAIYNNGGIVSITRPAPTVTDFALNDNRSFKGGGAIYTIGGSLTLDGIEIGENVANDGSGGGLAIFNQVANISRSLFRNNNANFFGGAIYASRQTTLNVSASTFKTNKTRLRGGGGIDGDEGSQIAVINSSFVGRDNRDGINVELGSGSVVNATMLSANLTGPLSVSNSILRDVVCVGISDRGLNLQWQSRCPTSIPRMNPLLDPKVLENNGGQTPTIALKPGSPAIDAIAPPNCIDMQNNRVTVDQRGFKRPAGAACDIGAFELNAAP